ncbi:MAG: family 20 glycosylhydrolase, partial [Candidatus Eremiobacteraeota bacterium]|nr:family 20 glycosylhydrolase [Candidatus Eremiobacteraeota bacterium]
LIVPRPRLVRANGRAYAWPNRVRVQARTELERKSAKQVTTFLSRYGISAEVGATAADVRLDVGPNRVPGVGSEGYAMSASSAGVRISANSGAGAFYALQSLEQLSTHDSGGLRTRGVVVRDWPRYAWRGMHLDVSRHFFGTSVIERYIAAAAHYKLNVFHWHLTDDQAWRIDIPRYPRLAHIGSCHRGRCESYTAAQVREVVRFARDRYVTIVPEIEIPGHSQAALRAYPQYACDRASEANVYCPTESTIAFLQHILDDVTTLFPGPYVHIGGDEVDFGPWRRSAFVHTLMRREGMTGYPQVQAYFTRRMQSFLRARGKRVVGWDEILEPGTAPSAVVMSWRGTAMAVRSVRRGHDAVVATDGPLYFDAFQGERAQEPAATAHMSTLAQVYDFNPTPDGLRPIEMQRILGAQATMWTERISTPAHLFYMAFPRELALAEILWTPSALKNWDSFLARLPPQLAWLAREDYAYRIPAPRIAVTGGRINFLGVAGSVQSANAWTDAKRVWVGLSEPARGAVLRYTIDGSVPTAASAEYAAPLLLPVDTGKRLKIAVVAFLPHGGASSVSRCTITHASTRDVLARRGASRTWAALVSP